MKTILTTAAAVLVTAQIASAATTGTAPATTDDLVTLPADERTENTAIEMAGYYVPTCYWETVWGPYGYFTRWVCG